MLKYFAAKPVKVEALQWLGTNQAEIVAFLPPSILNISLVGQLTLKVGGKAVNLNDWIMRTKQGPTEGEFSVMNPQTFEATYGEVLS